MLFNSIAFAIFLPIVFLLYWALPSKVRWVFLLASSYYFYMSWNVKYVVLIMFTTVISYVCGILLEKTKEESKRKGILLFLLVSCLSVLFVFKYFNFFFESLASICQQFAIPMHPITLKLMLPVGISFYTFQTIGYVIDVYRGDIRAEKNLGKYAAFISFFPQLVAGPIERSKDLLHQIDAPHTFEYDDATYGLKLMAWGFFKKIIIADTFARFVDAVYNDVYQYQGFSLVIVIFLFSIQIYCDFSGYSDIAIGTAKLFGIQLSTNFKSPYFSTSVKEFWSRWHISLSTWFRDYVYIPLGGNRCGKWKRSRNILITFLVSGLWHGANVTFVVWGGLHGLAQVIEGLVNKKKKSNVPKRNLFWCIKCVMIFIFSSLAWVVFRCNAFEEITYMAQNLFVGIGQPFQYYNVGLGMLGIYEGERFVIFASTLILMLYDYFSLDRDIIAVISNKNIGIRWSCYCVFMLVFFMFYSISKNNTFIYFQF